MLSEVSVPFDFCPCAPGILTYSTHLRFTSVCKNISDCAILPVHVNVWLEINTRKCFWTTPLVEFRAWGELIVIHVLEIGYVVPKPYDLAFARVLPNIGNWNPNISRSPVQDTQTLSLHSSSSTSAEKNTCAKLELPSSSSNFRDLIRHFFKMKLSGKRLSFAVFWGSIFRFYALFCMNSLFVQHFHFWLRNQPLVWFTHRYEGTETFESSASLRTALKIKWKPCWKVVLCSNFVVYITDARFQKPPKRKNSFSTIASAIHESAISLHWRSAT